MEPRIDAVRFGKITVNGETFKHDIVISLRGKVKKRKKKLSKQMYGTSHTISLDEIEASYQGGAKALILGTGFFDRVRLFSEVQEYLSAKQCQVRLMLTK
jgi:hypothetical protein